MQTIKLPYSTSKDTICLIQTIQQEYSCVVRFAYNRAKEDRNEKEIRKLVKSLNNLATLDAWLVQCAIREGIQTFKKNKDRKIVFGGSFFLKKWNKTKDRIWLNRWKQKRLFKFTSQGEACKGGNRKFEFDIINNNQIVFKLTAKNRFRLQLPKLRKNYKKILFKLEELMKSNKATVTISVDTNYIYITFDETLMEQEEYQCVENRIAAIDLNPNYIGFVVKDFNTNKIIHEEVVSLKDLNDTYFKLKGFPSTNPKKKKLTNQRRHLIFEISKRLTKLAKHYKCHAFVVEKLRMRSGDRGYGRNFNRLVNNQWLRGSFISNLRKRCNVIGIKFVEVCPQYSSTVGCICYPLHPDMTAAALELARRGIKLLNYEKGQKVVFPIFEKSTLLIRQWKDELVRVVSQAKDWKDLHKKIKESGVRYRFLLTEWYEQLGVLNPCTTKLRFIKIYSVL